MYYILILQLLFFIIKEASNAWIYFFFVKKINLSDNITRDNDF